MLLRFCLYGFLKNQRYFEPFLFLAFLDKGLTFLAIGVLVAIRDITINVLEIPSGAVADLFGRRRSLILSFCAYIASLWVFGVAGSFWALGGAMVLFAVGESFRTGTHKALIFTWLRLEGRPDEKTRVYGLTRSWSMYGSALSALTAAALVLVSGDYASVFLWSVIPCVLSIINLLGYPAEIDPRQDPPASVGLVWSHVRSSLSDAVRRRPLRRLLLESMGFGGVFRAAKDYLQPALVFAAALWLDSFAGDDPQKAASLVGPIYCLLFLGAGIASRNAHRFQSWAGGEAAAARNLWGIMTVVFLVLSGASAMQLWSVAIVSFMVLYMLQNLWRPILTSRIYGRVEEAKGATMLSVESQAQRLSTIALAPLFGWMFDSTGSLWPIAGLAAMIALGFRVRSPARSTGV